MSEAVKVALIIALAVIIATSLLIYFSPYHSCVRSGAIPLRCIAASGP